MRGCARRERGPDRTTTRPVDFPDPGQAGPGRAGHGDQKEARPSAIEPSPVQTRRGAERSHRGEYDKRSKLHTNPTPPRPYEYGLTVSDPSYAHRSRSPLNTQFNPKLNCVNQDL
ncbi:hypothetical protein MPTK1_4g18910 [Marchantia polymorpha subsp. ruderalis]|uniref:Uncharacterized protein n=2 Tax=Marchantia polymorpha TaxID=3197 RepID=A0AAF6BBE5_MARPO|nr:hypothetical protein MARPO_0164s0019 [Marchantia polymorpha]BBN09329.1 hypothetical protein Mp_4g18910 [Marchantia polymorpha subsp. ruderalis]|eukprot:PTQ28426.1 hypothetical protein MARPO_0164s0019 [Marchantia polymorpha]